MTLRKRYTLFTIFWIIFILLLFNIFVYLFVINITTRSEEQSLTDKVKLLLENTHPQQLASYKNPGLLNDFYNVNELIRIVSPSGDIWSEEGSDKELLDQPAVYYRSHDSGLMTIGGKRVLYMRVPLYEGPIQVASLEIMRKLNSLDTYLQILVVALAVTSAGAILFAIFGTYWFTSRLTSPIQQMVSTMREIDRSGKLRKIEAKPEDDSAEMQQLVRAFNQMIERLDRTFARQKQFVADASHELKTPLTVIGSYAGMLKRWGRDDAAVRDEAIESIAREVERLQNLTKSMLTLADAEQEDWLNIESFDLVPIVDELSEMMHVTFGRTVRVNAASGSVFMKGDRDKMRQLFVILIDNAIKYSKDSIDVTVSSVKQMVRVYVTDKGIGIPENEIPYLFERFYRVDGARSRATGGVGLGLSIAKRIVDLHDGQIDVMSKPGHGTTIMLQFPHRKG